MCIYIYIDMCVCVHNMCHAQYTYLPFVSLATASPQSPHQPLSGLHQGAQLREGRGEQVQELQRHIRGVGPGSTSTSKGSVFRNHQKSPEITRNHQKSPEITRNHQKSPQITRNHHKSPEITRNHQKSPEITRNFRCLPE